MRRLWQAQTDAHRQQLLDVSYAARGRIKPLGAPVHGGRGDVADWWLLDADGETVSCLLCYPLEFSLPDGTPISGFGLGAVSTLPSATKRGHAAWMCGEIGRQQAQAGRPVGLLYSGIPPSYYARLGYRVAAGWDWISSDLEAIAAMDPAPWTQADPRDERDALLGAYARHHRGVLSLRRDPALHDRTLRLNPRDTWHLCEGGYVRLEVDGDDLEVVEMIVPPDRAPAVLAACAAMALERGLDCMRGWLEPSEFVETWFTPRSREKTLPMVLGTFPNPSRFWSSDYF